MTVNTDELVALNRSKIFRTNKNRHELNFKNTTRYNPRLRY